MLTPTPLADTDIEHLQSLLDALPEPLQPLDVVALDGYLCGVLLQSQDIPEVDWWPGVIDVEGRAAPPGVKTEQLAALVRRRHDELGQAIAKREWFDPWVFAFDDAASTTEQVLPWVAGFAAAMDRFPRLMAAHDPALLEPLALLYLHFAPEDLEDADALLALIEEIEPPPDLAEAVQDIVRSVMLMADVSRPRAAAPLAPRRLANGRKAQKPDPRNTRNTPKTRTTRKEPRR
jgi:uncharacterized protein